MLNDKQTPALQLDATRPKNQVATITSRVALARHLCLTKAWKIVTIHRYWSHRRSPIGQGRNERQPKEHSYFFHMKKNLRLLR